MNIPPPLYADQKPKEVTINMNSQVWTEVGEAGNIEEMGKFYKSVRSESQMEETDERTENEAIKMQHYMANSSL